MDTSFLSISHLTDSEFETIRHLLLRLQQFIRAIPVAHSSVVIENGEARNRLTLSRNNQFFVEDFSYFFSEGQHTGYELAILTKLLCSRTVLGSNIGANIWTIFETLEPEIDGLQIDACEQRIRLYADFVHARLNALDSFCRMVAELLRTKSTRCELQKEIFNNFFWKPFRSDAPTDELNYLIPQGSHEQHFFQTWKQFRNKSTHADQSVYSPPSDLAELFQYSRRMHYGSAIFILKIVERFYDELTAVICKSEDWDEWSPQSIDEDEQHVGREVLTRLYMDKLRQTTGERLKKAFWGTGIHRYPRLTYDLPELQLEYTDENNAAQVDEGPDLLIGDQVYPRKLVIGSAGTGKSVMFYRMILRGQPRLLPFYLPMDSPEMQQCTDLLSKLEFEITGEDTLILTSRQRHAAVERLYQLLEKGSAVFFIDALDTANMDQIMRLADLMNRYPLCQYIAGIQPDAYESNRELIDSMNFQCFKIMPLTIEQVRALMNLASTHISGVDHTDKLYREITASVHGSDMVYHPFSVMMLIDLFEDNPQNIALSLNQTRLYRLVEQRIITNPNLDPEERSSLLDRNFIKQYQSDLKQILNLRTELIEAFKSQDPNAWQRTIITHPFIQENLNSAQKIFELMELLDEIPPIKPVETGIMRTLITVHLLSLGIANDSKAQSNIRMTQSGKLIFESNTLPMPNPHLCDLAMATSSIGIHLPQGDDFHTTDSSLVYRLRPRYLVQSYLNSLMEIYRQADISLSEGEAQLEALFKGIAYSGTTYLINKVFEPYWMRFWLISQQDRLPGSEVNGLAGPNYNVMSRALIFQSSKPSKVCFFLLKQAEWIMRWKMENTLALWRRYIRDIIVKKMNDEEREDLINKIPSLPKSICRGTIAYYTNMAIASMDSLALAQQYDPDVSTQLDTTVILKLMKKKSHPDALRILTFNLAFLKINNSLFHTLFIHLLRNGAATTPGVENILWNVVSENMKDKRANLEICKMLDKIPMEDIRKDIAEQIYDQRIYACQIKIREQENLRMQQWSEPVIGIRNDYLRPVSVDIGHNRRSIQYTLYSQPDRQTFVVASECISEMPEHKFCRIKGIDQWFWVQDVQDMKEEHPMTHMVEFTINLPNNAPRRKQGSIGIEIEGVDTKIPYIYLFEKFNNPQVVIRIDDPDWINQLCQSSTRENIKASPKINWYGYTGTIVGINIRPVNPNMRLIVLHPVSDEGGLYGVKFEPFDSIPSDGQLSFHHRKSLEQNPNGIALSMPSTESRASTTRIKDLIYLGCDHDGHYMASANELQAGNILRWSDLTEYAIVVSVSKIMPGQDSVDQIPKEVIKTFRRTIYMMTRNTQKGKQAQSAKSLTNKSPVFYQYIIKISPFTPADLPPCVPMQYSEGQIISQKIDIVWYHAVRNPVPEFWKDRSYPITVDSIPVYALHKDGNFVLRIPMTCFPKEIRYYATDEMPSRMEVKWVKNEDAEEQVKYCHILVDPVVKHIWTKNPRGDIRFYASRESTEPIAVSYKSLSSIINMSIPQLYHASIVPLLLREWTAARELTPEAQHFCWAKHQLVELARCYINRRQYFSVSPQIKLCYIRDIDQTEVQLFSPDVKYTEEGTRLFNMGPRLGQLSRLNDVTEELKKGMIVIRCNKWLLPLDREMVKQIGAQVLWGFAQGRITFNSRTMRYEVLEPLSRRYFIIPKSEYKNYLKKGVTVSFFPVLNEESQNEARYIQVL